MHSQFGLLGILGPYFGDSISCFWFKVRTNLRESFPFSYLGQLLKEENFPDGSDRKPSAYNERDPGLVPGSGRSPGEGHGNPLQYSCLEKSMDEPGGLQSMGLQRVGHDWATSLLKEEATKGY